MLNVTDEINRLKLKLSMDRVPYDIISGVESEIRQEIAERTYEALDSAMQRAHEVGEEYKIDKFLGELTAVKVGDGFTITTDSGDTNFSTAPFPMLPKLLKNAKVAKDGSTYKVIPMVKKGTAGLTTEKTMGDLNRARQDMKSLRGHKRLDSSSRGDTFIDMYNKQRSTYKSHYQKKELSGKVDFRTASSKQDANTQWVHPGRNADMTDTLKTINDDLYDQVQDIIRDVIFKYEGAL